MPYVTIGIRAAFVTAPISWFIITMLFPFISLLHCFLSPLEWYICCECDVSLLESEMMGEEKGDRGMIRLLRLLILVAYSNSLRYYPSTKTGNIVNIDVFGESRCIHTTM
ncbi:unnamed protein product [Haemonchus placei]|uniref:Secreted protein n=1 Tax=Haemonchus placei TaxID=6290 RepID=A0A0N4WZS7_HAEPC|nr:unnamed protein product [Haemonchus placei]